MSKKVAIIGAGVGGLAAANLLAKAGYTVTVYEKNAWLGGRAGREEIDGFIFDTGPSWYLMPGVFEQYFSLLDTSAAEQLKLIKLSPAYKVFFESHAPISISGNLAIDAATFEAIEPGAGKALERYVARSKTTYRLSLQHFLYSNFERIGELLQPTILQNAWRLLRFSTQSIHRYVSRFFRHPRLQQLLEYPMVFLGTSPYEAPALYSLMSALDFDEGVYYPKGTMYSVVESLVRLGKQLGVRYYTASEVVRIATSGTTVNGITLHTGELIECDYLIANGDLYHTETALLEPAYQSFSARHWQRVQQSPSALLLFLGVKGGVPELEHHSLMFVDAWRDNFTAIYDTKSIPAPASLYISKTSATDKTAPKGHENLFVLVPLPAGISLDAKQTDKLAATIIAQIESMANITLTERIVTKKVFGPDHFYTHYFSYQNSMLGPSHKLLQSAMFRTRNKSKKLDNLFYVGAGTVPGVGVPMCLISAELVYKRIAGIHHGKPLRPEEITQ